MADNTEDKQPEVDKQAEAEAQGQDKSAKVVDGRTVSSDSDVAVGGESAPAVEAGQATVPEPVKDADTKNAPNSFAANYNADKGAAAGSMVAPVFESASQADLNSTKDAVDQNGQPA